MSRIWGAPDSRILPRRGALGRFGCGGQFLKRVGCEIGGRVGAEVLQDAQRVLVGPARVAGGGGCAQEQPGSPEGRAALRSSLGSRSSTRCSAQAARKAIRMSTRNLRTRIIFMVPDERGLDLRAPPERRPPVPL